MEWNIFIGTWDDEKNIVEMWVKISINMPMFFYIYNMSNMISTTGFASISDLRDNTSTVVREVNSFWKKIILSQNKPVGVLLSVDEYNALLKLSFPSERAKPKDIKAYQNSSHWKDSVEAFSFLDTLS